MVYNIASFEFGKTLKRITNRHNLYEEPGLVNIVGKDLYSLSWCRTTVPLQVL